MTPKLPVGKECSLITNKSLPQKAEFRDFHLQTPNLSKQIPYTTDYFAHFLQWPPVSKFLPVATWLVTWNLIFLGRPPKIGSKISSDASMERLGRQADISGDFEVLLSVLYTTYAANSNLGWAAINGVCNWSPPWSPKAVFQSPNEAPNFLVEKPWHCGGVWVP